MRVLISACICSSLSQKNWFRLLESSKGESFPGNDTVYRFLNHGRYAWRRFLLSLGGETVQRMEKLTSVSRKTAFICDDSMFERNRSKAVEMLARFKDHATGAFYKGFRLLTMGWSDGHSFILWISHYLAPRSRALTASWTASTSDRLATSAGRKRFVPPRK